MILPKRPRTVPPAPLYHIVKIIVKKVSFLRNKTKGSG